MGKLDRERQRAIQVQLEEMTESVEEIITDAISRSEIEESREIEEEYLRNLSFQPASFN